MNKPKWTPPKWLFGPAWGVMYAAQSYSGWRVLHQVPPPCCVAPPWVSQHPHVKHRSMCSRDMCQPWPQDYKGDLFAACTVPADVTRISAAHRQAGAEERRRCGGRSLRSTLPGGFTSGQLCDRRMQRLLHRHSLDAFARGVA